MEDYSKLSSLAISDTGFVFNPLNGDSFTLNPTAKLILNMLKENKSKLEVLDIIIEKFDVDKSDAEVDFDNFISQLSMYKLL
jgi:hypothetical protein